MSEKNKATKISLKVASKNYYATGKRKCSIAKVWLFDGSGKQVVNNLNLVDYFNSELLVQKLLLPLNDLSLLEKFDFKASVLGGGKVSQCTALQLAISRALLLLNAENKSTLKSSGYLTRDPRIKERKKYGLRGARKAPQYRKR